MSSIHTQVVRLGTGPGQGTTPVSAENPLPVAGSFALDSGAKVTAVAALGAGGSGMVGWLSQIWAALTGTLSVSGPITDAQLRAAAVPVTVGQIATTTATISSGQNVSASIDLGLMRLGRIVMPTVASGWDAANLTLQTSIDGVTFNNLHEKDGTEYTITAAAGRSILIPLSDMLSVRYLRIRSGTSAAVVNQAAARTLTLVLVP